VIDRSQNRTQNSTTLVPSSTGDLCSNPPLWLLYPLVFIAVCLSHWTLLRLPYYWDEGGYYIPAALDFYRTGALVPHFTNAHPPLPNVVLGTLWHFTGFHVLATRMLVCAFASAALVAVFRLARNLLGAPAAFAITLLTAVYPIWFAQSSLAHADIFAAAFTLWGLSFYLLRDEPTGALDGISRFAGGTHRQMILTSVMFSLAAISKETAIVMPATLAALEVYLLFRDRKISGLYRSHVGWLSGLIAPVLPLVVWYAYHHHVTGFTFGNPEYLRYNATANFTFAHVYSTLHFRFLHLFWQRNIWLPLTLALACHLLPARPSVEARPLAPRVLRVIALLVAANWLAFSILGGAPLTRYLLPIYPLLLLVCVATWRSRLRVWPLLACLTFVAFVSALWINPAFSFAPEDNLAYRDMIVVDQEVAAYLNQHYPDARVLTAWPVSNDLFCPDLGYTDHPFKVVAVQDFTPNEITRVATRPADFDTAVVFSTHFAAPELQRYLLAHPGSRRAADFSPAQLRTPTDIARQFGGHIVWQDDHGGEWAAILRFPRPKTP
jgi:4-amino-4-deoxy-L-arabinose transferase-like glycosyltransferase